MVAINPGMRNAMKPHKLALAILGVFVSMTNGCILFEKFEVHYKISRHLTGELALIFGEVSSDEKTLEARKEEMKKFYDGGYLKEVEDLKNDNPWLRRTLSNMDSVKIELFDKTDTTCNAKVQGKIYCFPSSLAVLMSDDDTGFTFQKVGDSLYVTIGIENDSDSDTTSIFTLEYDGNIFAHNATKYDTTVNRLQWEFGKIQPPGIYFVLDVDL
jgi:hypothetical protein